MHSQGRRNSSQDDACARIRGHATVDEAKSGIMEMSDNCVIRFPRDNDSRDPVDNWPMFYTVQTKLNLADKLLRREVFSCHIERLLASCDGLLVLGV